jgi:C4-type Zn-finger protein
MHNKTWLSCSSARNAKARRYVGSIYICKDCGYRGSFVHEVDYPEGNKNVEREERAHRRPVRSHTKEG